ncbi:MAG: hypothetical protein KGJ07_02935 [Patescibacteria group bacterium]|nr:hypothetical protein [Patescibacteria group bacterium]MDE2590727.1 hypothetical protein [Patescibacteria group bacterium]
MHTLLQKEYGYFQNLGTNVQKFFLSCMLSGFADPVLYAFLTAFLYRTSHNFIAIAIYYSGFYIGLPIAFFLNGHCMRYFSSQLLYWAGTIIEGLIIICIIWGNAHGTTALFIWGVLFGIGAGFYWANRNFLTLRVIHAEKRMYYGSLESGIGTFITILAPFLSGSAIVLFIRLLPNGLVLSYRLLSLMAFVILFFTGLLIQTMEPVSQTMTSVMVRKRSKRWTLLRLFIINSGILSGILIFFPTLMIFTFLGKEGTLGYVQSLFAAVSALVVLFFASRISNRHALFFLAVSIFSLTFGSILFGIFFSALGVIAYLLFDAVGVPFSWAPYNTISFNTIDAEQSLFDYHHFAYIFDQELFLNIGRLVGMGIFLFCVFVFGSSFALRFSPFILSVLQMGQLFFVNKLIKTHSL